MRCSSESERTNFLVVLILRNFLSVLFCIFVLTMKSFATGLSYMYIHTHLNIKPRSKISNAFRGFNARCTNDGRMMTGADDKKFCFYVIKRLDINQERTSAIQLSRTLIASTWDSRDIGRKEKLSWTGPIQLPWGTPQLRIKSSEALPLTGTRYLRSRRNKSNHHEVIP